MYTISNDIIHVNESKYLTPATETRTRGSHGFKYFIEHTSNDVFKYSYFPWAVREWNSFPSDIVSALSLAITYTEISIRWPRLDFRRLPGPVFDPPRRETLSGGWVRAHFPEQRLVIEPKGDPPPVFIYLYLYLYFILFVIFC